MTTHPKFQSNVPRLLAAQRSPDSYIAGGVAINRDGPRISADIDIFHDSAARLESAVRADEAALAGGGYKITRSPNQRTGKHAATVEKQDERMQLEWVADSAFRFFPTRPDELFGYVLHPVDLAANKASATADRRVPRDNRGCRGLHRQPAERCRRRRVHGTATSPCNPT